MRTLSNITIAELRVPEFIIKNNLRVIGIRKQDFLAELESL